MKKMIKNCVKIHKFTNDDQDFSSYTKIYRKRKRDLTKKKRFTNIYDREKKFRKKFYDLHNQSIKINRLKSLIDK